MSQQIMTIVSLGARGRDMGDIEFLGIKEFDGKVRKNKGTKTSTGAGDLVSLTANTGKDMYLAEAEISLAGVSGTINTVQVDLVINGTVEETAVIATDLGSTTYGRYVFNLKGIKVAASQIIKLRVAAQPVTQVTVAGSLQVWEETTGETPQIPST